MTDGSSKRRNGDQPPPDLDDLGWSDREERTEQRQAPSTELLEAMKHPDVPAVVLEAIARRSSKPPPNEVIRSDADEDTNRYLLPPGAPMAARAAHAKSLRPPSAFTIEKPEDSLFMAFVLGFVMIAAVLGWLSFGLL